MSSVTGVSLNAVFPSGLLDRGQQAMGALAQPEPSLFTAVAETAAVSRNENRRELNPDERRQDNQRGKGLSTPDDGATDSEPVAAQNTTLYDDEGEQLRTREQLEAARRKGELSAEQEAQLAELQRLAERDREVRIHEQAHKASAGQYAGAVSYEFVRGPDGRRYAIAGEVPLDLAPAATPEQTIAKMEQIRRAALAPADPSSADRVIAVEAVQLIADARSEVLRQERLERAEQRAAREAERNEKVSARTQESADAERAQREEERAAEKESALDERRQAVNTDVEVRMSLIQAAIGEMLRNQVGNLDNVTLGKNVNFQI